MTKIISWNVNGLRTRIIDDKDAKQFGEKTEIDLESSLGELINSFEPDILCFQETRCSLETAKKFNLTDWYCYYNSSKSLEKGRTGDRYSGVAVWVKKTYGEPISVSNELYTLPEEEKEGRILTLEFDDFVLINTYVPNAGTNFDYRISYWDPAMKLYLETLREDYPKKGIVWAGDLNVAHKENDLFLTEPKYHYRKHKKVEDKEWLVSKKVKLNTEKMPGFTIEEREGFGEILEDGYLDVWRELHPEVEYDGYTWWNMRIPSNRQLNRGWRIDYFIVNREFRDRLVKCETFPKIGFREKLSSDHCPIGLEFN